MIFPSDIAFKARQVVESYSSRKKKIVTAESCTGGLVAAALTSVSGSSAVFERGFISYSYDAKSELLGILSEDLLRYGAVSPEIAEAMAQGALDFSRADVSLSVTGIAGPTGGLPNKPVGLCYFGIATREGVCFHFGRTYSGGREEIQLACVAEALGLFLSLVEEGKSF